MPSNVPYSLLVSIGNPTLPKPLAVLSEVSPMVRGIEAVGSIFPEGGVPPYTIAITDGAPPDGVSVDADGKYSGTPTTQNYYQYTVEVTDGNGDSEVIVIGTQVKGGIFFPAMSLAIESDLTYNFSLLATGGVAPLTWTIEDGALPTGASIVGNSIQGTSTNASNFSTVSFFLLRATDSLGNYAEAWCSMLLWPPLFIAANDAPQHASNVSPDAFLAGNYLGQISAVHGGFAGFGSPGVVGDLTYTYSISGGPPGIVCDPTTGALTGINTTQGIYTLAATVVDSLGGTYTRNFQITVFPNGSAKKFFGVIEGDDVLTDFTVTFSFGSYPYSVQVFDTFGPVSLADVEVTDVTADDLLLRFAKPPATGHQYNVHIVG